MRMEESFHMGLWSSFDGGSIRSHADRTLDVIEVVSMELISSESFDVAHVRDVVLVFVTSE